MSSTRNMNPPLTSAALLFLLAGVANAGLNAMTVKGCYSSSQPLVNQGSYQFQTSGYCQPLCVSKGKAVLATSNGSDCWCGDQVPAANTLVDNSKCNTPCNGYGTESCGGNGFFSVYLSGLKSDVTNYSGSDSNSNSNSNSNAASSSSAATIGDSTPAAAAVASPSTSSTTTAVPSVVTSVAPGATVVVTIPAHADTGSTASATPISSSSSSSGTNVAGIAAGVVIGVLAAIGLIVGALFWVRHRRRKAAEEDYKRANQVNDFMRGERKPPNTGYSNMSDSRLDPEYGRRNSAGSMADNQDYSRRILRVANPDTH